MNFEHSSPSWIFDIQKLTLNILQFQVELWTSTKFKSWTLNTRSSKLNFEDSKSKVEVWTFSQWNFEWSKFKVNLKFEVQSVILNIRSPVLNSTSQSQSWTWNIRDSQLNSKFKSWMLNWIFEVKSWTWIFWSSKLNLEFKSSNLNFWRPS